MRRTSTLELESAEAELAAATSSLAQASADLERFDALKERGHATTADFDRKQLARDEASARLERANRSLDLARRQVGYAELTADADGVIIATSAEPGQVVAVGQPVATLAHLDGKEAVVALPEDWFGVAGKARGVGQPVGERRPPVSMRRSASCRRTPTRRPAPTVPASPSTAPTRRSPSA